MLQTCHKARLHHGWGLDRHTPTFLLQPLQGQNRGRPVLAFPGQLRSREGWEEVGWQVSIMLPKQKPMHVSSKISHIVSDRAYSQRSVSMIAALQSNSYKHLQQWSKGKRPYGCTHSTLLVATLEQSPPSHIHQDINSTLSTLDRANITLLCKILLVYCYKLGRSSFGYILPRNVWFKENVLLTWQDDHGTIKDMYC